MTWEGRGNSEGFPQEDRTRDGVLVCKHSGQDILLSLCPAGSDSSGFCSDCTAHGEKSNVLSLLLPGHVTFGPHHSLPLHEPTWPKSKPVQKCGVW